MKCLKCGFDPELAATASWKFILHLEAKSLNVLRKKSAGRNDWYYSGYKKQIRRTLQETRGLPNLARARRRVTITRRFTRRQGPFDFDNLVGGFKPLVDSLVELGLLLGDTGSQAELYYDQARTNQPVGFVEVLIEDVDWPHE